MHATGGVVHVRDYGLLDAACHRPRACFSGREAYPSVHLKAAALLHSLVSSHPLLDGNKRVAFLATYTFLRLNGPDLAMPDQVAFELMIDVAAGHLADLDKIAERLTVHARPVLT